jgi:hypothetical protein
MYGLIGAMVNNHTILSYLFQMTINLRYGCYSNNASTNSLALKGFKSLIPSPTPI